MALEYKVVNGQITLVDTDAPQGPMDIHDTTFRAEHKSKGGDWSKLGGDMSVGTGNLMDNYRWEALNKFPKMNTSRFDQLGASRQGSELDYYKREFTKNLANDPGDNKGWMDKYWTKGGMEKVGLAAGAIGDLMGAYYNLQAVKLGKDELAEKKSNTRVNYATRAQLVNNEVDRLNNFYAANAMDHREQKIKPTYGV